MNEPASNGAHESRQEAGAWPLALGLACALFLAYPLLWPGRIGLDGDSACAFFPATACARSELLAGRIPLWNPYKFLGVPFLADTLIPIFYPPQALGLLFPQPFGHALLIVAHLFLAGALAYMLAREGFGAGPAGAAMAAAVFALGAPAIARIVHWNHVRTIAWLPLVWLLALRVGRPGSWRRQGAALGAALGMMALAAQPQLLLYATIPLGLTAAGRLARGRGRRGQIAAAYLLGGAIGAGLGAVQALPALELARHSVRPHLSYDVAMQFSLPWRSLACLAWPGAHVSPTDGGFVTAPNTEMEIYLGLPALALAALGTFVGWRERKTILLLAVAAAGWILALGGNTPLYRALEAIGIEATLFRVPARAFVLTALAIGLLGARGMDALADSLRRASGSSPQRARLARVAPALAFAAQIAALAFYRFGVLRLPSGDAASARGEGLEKLIPARGLEGGRLFSLMDEVDYLDATESALRRKAWRLQPDMNMLKDVRVVAGYEGGLMPPHDWIQFMRHFRRNLYTPYPDTRLLGLMGVRWIAADKTVAGAALRRVGSAEGVMILENLDWRGEVFTRADWPGVDFDLLGRAFDLAIPETAIQIGASDLGARPRRSSFSVRRLSPGRIEVSCAGDTPGEILLSEGWMPGWVARTSRSGEPIPGRRVAPFLIGFDVPTRGRSIEISYEPPGFGIGLGITMLGLLAMIGAALPRWPLRRSRIRSGG